MSGTGEGWLGQWIPSKAWGQNYLINGGVIEKIVDLLPVQARPVIEIGSGRGALTTELLARGFEVIAIEPHRESAAYLTHRFGADPHFSLLEEDATTLDLSSLLQAGKTGVIAPGDITSPGVPTPPGVFTPAVIGNLPYCVAARILFALIRTARAGSPWVLMFQREVAQRIVAGPHSREYGLLSVVAQLAAGCTICFHVSPGSFSPAPKITSSVVRFEPRPARNVDWNALSVWLTRIFSMRRKQMGNIMASMLSADRIQALRAAPPFSLQLRPEQLSPEVHLDLFERCRL
ncbi:MAG: ribosomal RNA small subunit methyltransferase A [Deltaproteobacteria bacterium HGW-Deltaproteobacteria-22]|jgi:16S rRNA (adenine1518-N6/adenine1519-N6)-dimethyltransferase|nr:MAG: ribosomal RNA small subunit methyltransferase A [Deltaproteobacteria bacterium HGW-Deltaproteobacteria-22]